MKVIKERTAVNGFIGFFGNLRTVSRLSILILIFSVCKHLFGFENLLFPPKDFQTRFRKSITVYQLSSNPALYRNSVKTDYTYYRFGASDRLNAFRRLYDPKRERDYGLSFFASKNLSENSTIAALAGYERTDYFNLYRSLEKDFYSNYFSYIDTTTGDVKYDGPHLWFLYNYTLADKVHLGIQVDYGVERGLKNVYTKCETIVRNTEFSTGIGYQITNRAVAGAFIRYFSRQSQYEAVKEYQDALVKTYYGYHIFRVESPRSSNYKNDFREGYEYGFQFDTRDAILKGLEFQAMGSYGARLTDVDVGSSTSPRSRGYWVREGRRFISGLQYKPGESDIGFSAFYEYGDFSDWAKSGLYEVVVLENEEIKNRYSLTLYLQPSEKIDLYIGNDIEEIDCDYTEYLGGFRYLKKRKNRSAFSEILVRWNPVLSLYLRGEVAEIQPEFYWNTDEFDINTLTLGLERLFVFATFGLELERSKWKQFDSDKGVDVYGISIVYKR